MRISAAYIHAELEPLVLIELYYLCCEREIVFTFFYCVCARKLHILGGRVWCPGIERFPGEELSRKHQCTRRVCMGVCLYTSILISSCLSSSEFIECAKNVSAIPSWALFCAPRDIYLIRITPLKGPSGCNKCCVQANVLTCLLFLVLHVVVS